MSVVLQVPYTKGLRIVEWEIRCGVIEFLVNVVGFIYKGV